MCQPYEVGKLHREEGILHLTGFAIKFVILFVWSHLCYNLMIIVHELAVKKGPNANNAYKKLGIFAFSKFN